LVLSIFSFQFSDLLIFVSFKINQEYIAKNLCVEKDVEDSTCKGCCQLKKKFEKQHEQEKQVPPEQNNKQNINFITQTGFINNCFPFYTEISNPFICENHDSKFLTSVFHPPEKLS
jgi:hypothetical protein